MPRTRAPSNPEPTMSNPAPRSTFQRHFRGFCWVIGRIITLNYASKYARKIENWKTLASAQNTTTPGVRAPIRDKQQREWDRLSTSLSIITATSAASLAIPSPFGTGTNIYWVSTACFSAALGMSLGGLILLNYLTIFAAGTSDLAVGHAASGEALYGLVGLLAFVISLPTVLTTYSSLFLLAGLMSMVIVKGKGEGIEQHEVGFTVIVLIPVCLMLVCLLVAVVAAELFAKEEIKKDKGKPRDSEQTGESTGAGDGTKADDAARTG